MQANLRRILKKLKTQNQLLDQQLARHLSQSDFEKISALISNYNKEDVASITKQIQSRLTIVPPTLEELSRPSLSDLSQNFKGRLVRI